MLQLHFKFLKAINFPHIIRDNTQSTTQPKDEGDQNHNYQNGKYNL